VSERYADHGIGASRTAAGNFGVRARRHGHDLAAGGKINSSYVSRLMRLTLLAPEMVEAILDGRHPGGMTLPGLMEPMPAVWAKQRSPVSLASAIRPTRVREDCRHGHAAEAAMLPGQDAQQLLLSAAVSVRG
jgi:hypothetical protein